MRKLFALLALLMVSLWPWIAPAQTKLTGTPTASAYSPTTSGSPAVVIADGVKPAVGATANKQQYDGYTGEVQATAWVALTFPSPQTITRVVWQEGMHFGDGGWCSDAPRVEVRNGTTWATAPSTITPDYAGNNGVNFESFTFALSATGDGVRIACRPGGSATFISAGELEAYTGGTLGRAVVSWTPPTKMDDGSTITSLQGYRVRYGMSATSLDRVITVAGPGTTSVPIEGLEAGTWHFAVTSLTALAESDLSPVVSKTISATEPPPPSRWAVRQSSTGTRPAHELVRNKTDTAWARGYKLGDIAAGKPCDDARVLGTPPNEYHEVTESDVALLSPTYHGRTLIAVCVQQ